MRRIQGTILPEVTPLKSNTLPGSSVPPRWDYVRTRERIRLPRFSRVFCGSWRIATGLLLLAAIMLGAQPEPAHAQTGSESATYTVTFEGNWNTDSTPDGVAPGAHFTTLIGAVHNSDVTFWAAGEMATAGVEGWLKLAPRMRSRQKSATPKREP